MKEQMAKMTIIELVKTAHNYATSIKQTGVYSDLVGEIASRLEALNLAYIGLTKKSNAMQSERDHLAAQLADVVAENAALKANVEAHAAGFSVCPSCGHEEPCETDDVVWMTRDTQTPATDRFLAERRAEGGADALEKFAEFNIRSIDDTAREYTEHLNETARAARGFAAQLRNEVKV